MLERVDVEPYVIAGLIVHPRILGDGIGIERLIFGLKVTHHGRYRYPWIDGHENTIDGCKTKVLAQCKLSEEVEILKDVAVV